MTAETCDQKRARLAYYIAKRDAAAFGGTVIGTRLGEKESRKSPGDIKRMDTLIAELKNDIARNCDNCRRGRMLHITPSG